jgi:cytochrome c5
MRKAILPLSLALGMFSLTQIAAAETAADTYKAKCAMCHAADGTGNTSAGKAMKARDFHDADVIKASDADLIEVITKGRNKMPAYGTKLNQDQIKGLVAHIRGLEKSGK